MEELTLTDPIITPAKSTTKYSIVVMHLDLESKNSPPVQEPGLIHIQVKDNLGAMITCLYFGKEATDFIKFMNTANFSVNSMNKRILQKLSTDGKLPPGQVTGAPEP